MPRSKQTLPADSPHRAIQRANRALAVRQGRPPRHGIYSNDLILPEVLDEVALLYARALWLDETRDAPLVEATARLIIRLRRIDALINAEGPTQLLTSWSSRTEGQLLRNLDALGLTPRSAADLGLAHLDAKERVARMTEMRLAAYRPKGKPKPASDESEGDD